MGTQIAKKYFAIKPQKITPMRRTESSTKGGASSAPTAQPLVVVSHLRWDFVWQRPQQILSRLSYKHRVLFVEEPTIAPAGAEPEATLQIVNSTLSILKPQVYAEECGDTPMCLWPCEMLV